MPEFVRTRFLSDSIPLATSSDPISPHSLRPTVIRCELLIEHIVGELETAMDYIARRPVRGLVRREKSTKMRWSRPVRSDLSFRQRHYFQ